MSFTFISPFSLCVCDCKGYGHVDFFVFRSLSATDADLLLCGRGYYENYTISNQFNNSSAKDRHGDETCLVMIVVFRSNLYLSLCISF